MIHSDFPCFTKNIKSKYFQYLLYFLRFYPRFFYNVPICPSFMSCWFPCWRVVFSFGCPATARGRSRHIDRGRGGGGDPSLTGESREPGGPLPLFLPSVSPFLYYPFFYFLFSVFPVELKRNWEKERQFSAKQEHEPRFLFTFPVTTWSLLSSPACRLNLLSSIFSNPNPRQINLSLSPFFGFSLSFSLSLSRSLAAMFTAVSWPPWQQQRQPPARRRCFHSSSHLSALSHPSALGEKATAGRRRTFSHFDFVFSPNLLIFFLYWVTFILSSQLFDWLVEISSFIDVFPTWS